MRTPQLATRSVRLLAVPPLLAGVVVAGVAPVVGATRRGPAGPATSFTINGTPSHAGCSGGAVCRPWVLLAH